MTLLVPGLSTLAGLAAPSASATGGRHNGTVAAAAAYDPPIAVGGGWLPFTWSDHAQPIDDEGPFTFTNKVKVSVTVTDDFCRGDRFEVFDNGTSLGTTAAVPVGPCNDTGADAAFVDPTYSHGSFLVDPGDHKITIKAITNPDGFGQAWLRVDPPPICPAPSVVPGPPKQIKISVQSPFPGLLSVTHTQTNATVAVASFTVGTTSPVVVTATKTKATLGSTVALKVTDKAGNVTVCDPTLVTVAVERGRHNPHTVTGIDGGESRVSVVNGDPGLAALMVKVNGAKTFVLLLQAGQRVLDISSAMVGGKNNTISLTGIGRPGGQADVLISK